MSNRCPSRVEAQLEGLSGDELLAVAGEAIRRAAGRSLDEMDDEGLVTSVAGWHRLASAVHGEQLRRVAAVERREAWRGHAYNGVNLWTARLGVSRGEARSLVESAVALERMPRTARRLADGRLGAGHVADAARTITQLERLGQGEGQGGDGQGGDGGMEATAAALDGLLAGEADRHAPAAGTCEEAGGEAVAVARPVSRGAVRQQLREFQHERAPELLAEREQRLRARRSVRFGEDRHDPDEAPTLYGRLAPLTSAKARSVLYAMARQHDAGDPRSFAQRCHDAFDRVLDLAIASGELPEAAGEQPRVLLSVSADTLHDRPGAPPATLDGYGPVSAGTARQICCDAEVTAVATGEGGRILDVGRDRRRPDRRQRRAIFARDQGCVGCGAPLASCQIHHIVFWSDGGPTDIDNLVAVCWDCHARIHQYGWRVVRHPGGSFRLRPPDRPGAAEHRRAG